VRRGFQLLLLTMAAAAANYAQTALSPLQEAVKIASGLSDNQMALLQGPALALPLAAAAIPVGLLIDRYSRARLIIVFALFDLLGSAATAMANTFPQLFAARCLVGLAVPATSMAALSMIADVFAPAQRGRALTVLAMGQVGGMSAAFALGGMLLKLSGSGPEAWRWAMAWLSAPAALTSVLVLMTTEPPRTHIAVTNPSPRQAFAELWRYRTVIGPLLASVIMVGLADTASMIWAAPTLARSFAAPPERVGAIMAAALLTASILGPIAGGILADFSQRTGGPPRTITVLCGLCLLSAASGLFPIMPNVMSASFVLTLFMATGSAIGVTGAPLGTVVIPNELRGLYMAVSTAISTPLCLGLAPLIVSQLSTALGGPVMIGRALALVCVTISVIGAVALALGRRHFAGRQGEIG